jgi:hypothetical protein
MGFVSVAIARLAPALVGTHVEWYQQKIAE